MARHLMGLYKALQTLSDELGRELPVTQLLITLRLAVAGDIGIDNQKVMDEVELSSAGMVRAIATLGAPNEAKGAKEGGLGVIERLTDPKDQRRRVLRLTPKGQKAVAKALEQLK